MKKFFKSLGKKASKGPPAGGSPKLGATAKPSNSTSSLIGYDVKEKELSKLHKAAWLDDVGKVRQLAKKDPSGLDKENRTPLHLACARGHADVVEALLEWKAKTNIGDNNSKTPLMKAVEGGHEECVTLLLESRADVDAMDKDGNTCLHMACNFNDPDIVILLLQRNPRLDIKNKEGLAPLHCALNVKSEDLCRMLLREGADVNSEDLTGRTCLMKACQEGSINLVKILLEFDADTAHKDTKGWTADDCAVIQGHHACSQLISDHNVRQNMANRTPASTPRSSLPPSLAATPRDKSLELGAPALDAGGDDSGDETLSKGSEGGAKGAGYDDSWGDDSLSLAVDDKKVKVAGHKVSLAKFIPDSDEGDSSRASKMARLDEEDEGNAEDSRLRKQDSAKSVQSNTSWEEDSSWSVNEPKKTTPRVSFKRGEELSQIHDISVPDSEEDHYSVEGKPISTMAPSQQTGSYVPTGMSGAPIVTPISADKQRAFMEELGISDADDLSEADVSEMSGAEPKKAALAKTDDDSDWDSTAMSDPISTPRPGILKNWRKQSNVDEDEMDEDDEGGGGGGGRGRLGKPKDAHEEPESSMWDSTAAEAAIREDKPPPLPTSPVPQRNSHIGVKQPNVHDVSNQESDWDSTVGMVTPRQNAGLGYKEVRPGDEDEDLSELGEEEGAQPLQPVVDQVQRAISQIAGVHATPREEEEKKGKVEEEKQQKDVEEGEDEDSDWDSDVDLLPSDNAPGPPQSKVTTGQRGSQHSRSADSDEDVDTETISEWEIEWKKQKESAKKSGSFIDFEDITDLTQGNKEREAARLQAEEEENQRKREQEQKQKEAEERRQAEEERKRQEEEQERRLEEAAAEERKRVAEEQRREAERLRQEELRQEEERKREEEEELKRQKEWERQELQRQEQLKREAEAALEAERQALADVSSEEDSFANKDVVDHGREKEEDDFELSDKDIPLMVDKARSVAPTVTDGAPSILMTEFDGSVEELKRIEEQVHQENLLGKKTTSSENGAIKKSVQELSQSSSAIQSVGAKAQVQPMVRQQMVYVPPPSLPPSKSTSQMLKKRLQVPPPSQVGLQNRMEDFDDEDSYASDNGNPDSPRNERPDVTSYYPNLLGSGGPGYNFNLAVEDDALSYTSTEFETESLVGRSTEYSPFAKDMLLNLNMNDPTTLLKLQEHYRDQRRQFEQEKNHRQMLENKLKLLNTDRTEFQKKIETLTQHKLTLEQDKLDLEAKIRGLQYSITEEEEKRRNAEVLLEKTKDQLNRKEEKYTSSVEEKQKAELERRNMVMELRAINNRVKELEGEREELERQLEHERETRLLQEKINEEQTKFQQQLQQEKVKAVSQMMAKRSSQTGDDSDEDRMEVNETLKAELFALQAEVERQRARSKDESALLSAENEDLHAKIEELKNEIKLNEEALTQATMQYSVQIGSLKADYNVLTSDLEKEKAANEKLEAELESQRTRLLSTTSEMEKASQARNELERELQHSREELRKEMERKEIEIEKFKETNRELTEKLNTTDVKTNSLEKELHVANTSLLERTNQLKQINHNLDSLKTSLDNMDQNYKMEKEHNSKLQTKIETLQEKLTQAQHDSLSLKQQLETVRQVALQDASMDAHEKFNAMMASLKTEHEKSKEVLEEKNSALNETITRMREEMRNSENRRSTLETDMRHHSQEQNELIKKLSQAEASLEIAQRMKEQIDQERNQLKLEVERLQQKYQAAHEKSVESQARVSELVDRMERAEQSSLASNQQLLHTSANIQAFSKSKDEVEGNFQKLLIENTRLEAELKHEKQRAEMLHQDLQDSQKVRSSLEALCSNLKSTNAHLEDKLGPSDDLDGSIKESNMAQLDRQKQEAQGSVEEEKRKARKALESKKIAESKLEAEREKSLQLQKEVTTLKIHLKNAKKRVKDPTLSDSCVVNLNHEFDKERFEMDEALTAARRQNGEASVSHGGGGGSTDIDQIRAQLEAKYRQELNRKLEEVNRYLEEQARARDRLDMSRGENESRISLDKKRLEDENLDLKLKYEKAVAKCETKEMEVRRFRELYDSEMKWRMRLSDQLERATSRAGDYKTKLAVERNHRTKFVSSMNNLNLSAISNGMSMDASRLNTSTDDPLSNKLRAELDRSIAKHLEAAPHDDTVPVVRTSEKSLLDSSFAKSSAEYYEILKKKYCI